MNALETLYKVILLLSILCLILFLVKNCNRLDKIETKINTIAEQNTNIENTLYNWFVIECE